MQPIAYLVNTYPRGSHSFIWREIHALEQRGMAVTRIAARRPDEAPADPGIAEEQAQTVYLNDDRPALARAALRAGRALPLARARAAAGEAPLRRMMAYAAQGRMLADLCRARGITHVHAHFGTNPARVAAFSRLFGGPPFSVTVHGPEEFDRPEALDLAGKAAAAAFTVAVSRFGRSQLMRWVDPAHWDRLRVVHCGLSLDEFTPTASPPGPPRLVAVGRLAEQKGFGLLVPALIAARAVHPDLTLTLVGDGPLRGAIEAQALRAGLGEALRLTGWLSPAEVRAQIAQADALVVPSFAEGLPVVIMEAMALARPVVSTWIAGIPELVVPGQTGWLVAPGDAAPLAHAMVEVAGTSADQRAAMGQAGRARVIARHDVTESARRLTALIAETTPAR
ncbi:glycosyltransferase family 4 protein [Paracoccus endophyticus]|uniref:glycosyltransferase family 4 protein n=1 Tax=Paracoccus endophyticus TaxID=2233774 RepID=UPI000DD88FB8|nr:glycosyltransferase family 4 protein [Paracoccus endophyticus]